MPARRPTVTCPECGYEFIPNDTEVRKLAAPIIEPLETQNQAYKVKLERAGKTGAKVAQLTYTGNRGDEGYAKQDLFTRDLSDAFPEDAVSTVRRFNAGADVHQVIRYGGARAGMILWEVKRAADWGRDWLDKLAANRDSADADIGVIVSAVLPPGVDTFKRIDDVYVTSFDCAVPVAEMLRTMITRAYRDERAAAERDGHEGKAFDYLLIGRFPRRYSDLDRITEAMWAEQLRKERDFARQSKKDRARIQELRDVRDAIPGDLYEVFGADAQLPELFQGELPAGGLPALPAGGLPTVIPGD
jgi:hypothetical protein